MIIELKKTLHFLKKNNIKYSIYHEDKEAYIYITKKLNKNIVKTRYNICLILGKYYGKNIFCLELYRNNYKNIIDYKTYRKFSLFQNHLNRFIKR